MKGFASVKWLMVCLCLAVSVMVSAPLLAQTPDGETPAEETVCDPLKADGVTKGLYGLCVAFCEAQDHAALSDPITEEELIALAEDAPSGRILANYNKKKQESDPDMPCIKVEEPCPCWTAEELALVDGYLGDGTSVSHLCRLYKAAPYIREGKSDYEVNEAQAHYITPPEVGYKKNHCRYLNHQEKPKIMRLLSLNAGTLTNEEAKSCADEVRAYCEASGF